MPRTVMGVLLVIAAASTVPADAVAAGSQNPHVKIFIRLDGSGRCTSSTPGIVEVFAGGTITWDIVRVKSLAGSCGADTRIQVDFPRNSLGNVAAPAAQPAVAEAEESAFASEKATLDAGLKPEDGDQMRRFATGAAPAPGGAIKASPQFASRLTAKATGAPGLYKYNVRIVGGAVEDPPFKIIPPP